ncbi:MAG: hypothetical protein ACRDP5_17550 [Streptosporangiaceae bacterium]
MTLTRQLRLPSLRFRRDRSSVTGIARTVQDYIQQLNASNTRAIVDLYTDAAAFFQPDRG